MATRYRPDRDGSHKSQYKKNKAKIFASQTVCGICGQPVDFSLKYPHPLSATVDHIIPVAAGGHPSDIENMQLAHLRCNQQKGNKLIRNKVETEQVITNRDLPLHFDYTTTPPTPLQRPARWYEVPHRMGDCFRKK